MALSKCRRAGMNISPCAPELVTLLLSNFTAHAAASYMHLIRTVDLGASDHEYRHINDNAPNISGTGFIL